MRTIFGVGRLLKSMCSILQYCIKRCSNEIQPLRSSLRSKKVQYRFSSILSPSVFGSTLDNPLCSDLPSLYSTTPGGWRTALNSLNRRFRSPYWCSQNSSTHAGLSRFLSKKLVICSLLTLTPHLQFRRKVILVYCRNCEAQISDKAAICVHCGVSTSFSTKRSGVPGVLGFIFSLAGIFLPIPVLDVMISIAGLVLSIVGMIGNRRYRGLAIAGLVISIFSIIGGIVLIMFAPWFYHGIWYYG